MGIRAKNLNLAYRFSTSPQKELPQMLQTPLHLARLFNNARKILDERATGKSKSKKEFRVILVNQNAGKRGGKTTEGKKVSFSIERSCSMWSESSCLRSRRKRKKHNKALIQRQIAIATVMPTLHQRRKLACNMLLSCKQNMLVVIMLVNIV